MSNDNGTMSIAEQLAALKAENEALKAKVEKKSTLTCKVSEKGGLSLYGVGRFPVTLYAQQWERVLGFSEQITAFIAANSSKLTRKE